MSAKEGELTAAEGSTQEIGSAGTSATGEAWMQISSFGLEAILGSQQFANYLGSIIEDYFKISTKHSLEAGSHKVEKSK